MNLSSYLPWRMICTDVTGLLHGLGDDYRICPIKRALRRGNDRVCIYLLTKNGSMSFTSNNSSAQGQAPFIIHVGNWVDRREGVK